MHPLAAQWYTHIILLYNYWTIGESVGVEINKVGVIGALRTSSNSLKKMPIITNQPGQVAVVAVVKWIYIIT